MSFSISAPQPAQGLFICGTDTGVGKTYVSCQIAKTLTTQDFSVGVYKPVASGAVYREGDLVAKDAEALQGAAQRKEPLAAICPQVFAQSLAPPVAAEQEGRQVDRELLRCGISYWKDRCDLVVVEGVGGLLSPISRDDFTVTLVKEFGYPVVLVAADRLGVINHVLQAVCTLKTYASGVPLAGIVLNQMDSDPDGSCASNAAEIRARCRVPVLGQIAWQAPAPLDAIDWHGLATAR